jgi:hypothetical protein
MRFTVEFRCDERDARLFGGFGESLVLNFSFTDLNGTVEAKCRQSVLTVTVSWLT